MKQEDNVKVATTKYAPIKFMGVVIGTCSGWYTEGFSQIVIYDFEPHESFPSIPKGRHEGLAIVLDKGLIAVRDNDWMSIQEVKLEDFLSELSAAAIANQKF